MFTYGIGFILTIKRLKAEYHDVTQPWYAYDYVALGMFDNIGLYSNSLKLFSPVRGYYPEPSKIVLIMHPDNLTAGKYFGLCHVFKVCTGACYLGGFIGFDEFKRDWLKYRTSK